MQHWLCDVCAAAVPCDGEFGRPRHHRQLHPARVHHPDHRAARLLCCGLDPDRLRG
ncbi:hypothetical protein SGPA1_40864 [Streptomyces misionensis JCM 4497]